MVEDPCSGARNGGAASEIRALRRVAFGCACRPGRGARGPARSSRHGGRRPRFRRVPRGRGGRWQDHAARRRCGRRTEVGTRCRRPASRRRRGGAVARARGPLRSADAPAGPRRRPAGGPAGGAGLDARPVRPRAGRSIPHRRGHCCLCCRCTPGAARSWLSSTTCNGSIATRVPRSPSPRAGSAMTGSSCCSLGGQRCTAMNRLISPPSPGFRSRAVAIQDGVRLLDGTRRTGGRWRVGWTVADGNPLALLESARSLTPEQRRGICAAARRRCGSSAPADRPCSWTRCTTLSPAGAVGGHAGGRVVRRRGGDRSGGPSTLAGIDPDSRRPAEAGAGRHSSRPTPDHALRFRHPLVRNAVLADAGDERGPPACASWRSRSCDGRRTVGRGCGTAPRASVGPTTRSGESCYGLADSRAKPLPGTDPRPRCCAERAAALMSAPGRSSTRSPAAIEDAVLSGDVDAGAPAGRARDRIRAGGRCRRRRMRGHSSAPASSKRSRDLCPDAVDLLNRAVELGSGSRPDPGAVRAAPGPLPVGVGDGHAQPPRTPSRNSRIGRTPSRTMLVSYSCARRAGIRR